MSMKETGAKMKEWCKKHRKGITICATFAAAAIGASIGVGLANKHSSTPETSTAKPTLDGFEHLPDVVDTKPTSGRYEYHPDFVDIGFGRVEALNDEEFNIDNIELKDLGELGQKMSSHFDQFDASNKVNVILSIDSKNQYYN